MSIVATVLNNIRFTGDQESELTFSSGDLANSVCYQQVVNLGSGNNDFDVPDVDGFTVHGVAIIPPSVNTIEPTLKGNAADTGIVLSASQVSVIQFGATPPVTIDLVVATEIAGFRLIWF